jgi:recombinational DNA repair protein (RecF pathway)
MTSERVSVALGIRRSPEDVNTALQPANVNNVREFPSRQSDKTLTAASIAKKLAGRDLPAVQRHERLFAKDL